MVKIHQQKGFGLIEVLLSLAVAAAIMVLGINYYSTLRSAQKASRLINQMHGISTTVQTYIAKHVGEDLNKVFSSGKIDIVSANVVPIAALDAQNIWAPTSKYQIFVTIGGQDATANGCNTIRLEIPKGVTGAACTQFKDKIKTSFDNATVTCKDSTASISYCANKTVN
jgi:prepilin-type N-terminal cleavage/methylation domain-containing protein